MVKNASGERKAGATIKKKIKMTIAATAAPTSGRARRRFDQPSFRRFDASAGAPTDEDGLAGVVLREREDGVDVVLVDERRTGQHGLAATHVVAVLLVEVE